MNDNKRFAIGLLAFISLPTLFVPPLLSWDHLFVNSNGGSGYYLETNLGLALIFPLFQIPFLCYLISRKWRCEAFNSFRFGFVLMLGFSVGALCGLMLSWPAFLNHQNADVDTGQMNFHLNAAGNPTFRKPPPESDLLYFVYILCPINYGMVGLISSLSIQFFAIRRNVILRSRDAR